MTTSRAHLPLAFPAAIAALWGCVPDYNPQGDGAAADGTDVECAAVPPPMESFPPSSASGDLEVETGYDHRGGTGDDRGVIHHEAYLDRDSGEKTIFSVQDFYADGLDRSAGATYELEDEFCDPEARRCCEEPTWCVDAACCTPPGSTCRSDEPCCDEPFCCEDPPCCDDPHCPPGHYNYVACDLCVLYLTGCPYESIGGCTRQFMAIEGTLTFEDFAKESETWNQDTLERLSLRLEGMKLEEVVIDPVTFTSSAACPAHRCPAYEDVPGDCLSISTYSFSYEAEQ